MQTRSAMEEELAGVGREEIMSALFAHLVIQQTNLALMLLGKAPHPETGQTVRDVEAAKMFIDQLEMLEVKTRSNLNKQEDQLLKQSLMTLRLAFVETVDSPATPAAEAPATPPAPQSAQPTPAEKLSGASGTAPAAGEDESHKKFVKKY